MNFIKTLIFNGIFCFTYSKNLLLPTVSLLAVLLSSSACSMDIFEAISKNNLPRVQELIAAGVNPDAYNFCCQTPLFLAAYRGQTAIVKALIEAGAHVNCYCRIAHACYGAGPSGFTPLHFAAQYGYFAIAQALVAAGANLNIIGADGDTPVQSALRNEYLEIFDLLADHEQRIKQAKEKGRITGELLALGATHARIGQHSPLLLMSQDVLQYISQLAGQAEEHDARQPRQTQEQAAREAKINLGIIALGTDERLGAGSPMSLLCGRHILHDLFENIAQATAATGYGHASQVSLPVNRCPLPDF